MYGNTITLFDSRGTNIYHNSAGSNSAVYYMYITCCSSIPSKDHTHRELTVNRLIIINVIISVTHQGSWSHDSPTHTPTHTSKAFKIAICFIHQNNRHKTKSVWHYWLKCSQNLFVSAGKHQRSLLLVRKSPWVKWWFPTSTVHCTVHCTVYIGHVITSKAEPQYTKHQAKHPLMLDVVLSAFQEL